MNMMTTTATATDPQRERARRWRVVGERVRQAMPVLASLMRPSGNDFKAAATALGVTVADAQRAWHFAAGDIEAPSKEAPALGS